MHPRIEKHALYAAGEIKPLSIRFGKPHSFTGQRAAHPSISLIYTIKTQEGLVTESTSEIT